VVQPVDAFAECFDYAATYSPPPSAEQARALWHRTLLAHDLTPDDAAFARLTGSELASFDELSGPLSDAANIARSKGSEQRRLTAWPHARWSDSVEAP
jgi:hypothetical protein